VGLDVQAVVEGAAAEAAASTGVEGAVLRSSAEVEVVRL